jgi:hypothetical protein
VDSIHYKCEVFEHFANQGAFGASLGLNDICTKTGRALILLKRLKVADSLWATIAKFIAE